MSVPFAEKMAQEFIGQTVGGWTIERRLGNGKSATVFRAERDGEVAALKIFDRDLVAKFGKAVQLQRVQRERELVGHSHPNLIRIIDAGEDLARDAIFVAMDLFEGKNLAERLQDVPPTSIRSLISQLAAAAQYLEGIGLVHRDIKPENVGVSDDFSKVVLLDLGVVRPVVLSKITDEGGKQFVATLQYAPPELVLREEGDGLDVWRAINFYQLGAVLHDLIAKRALFEDYVLPYGRLVKAVADVAPKVIPASEDVPRDLVSLALNCLVKDPNLRVKLVSWAAFEPKLPGSKLAQAQERIAARQARASTSTLPPSRQPLALTRDLERVVGTVLRALPFEHQFPAVTVATSKVDAGGFEVLFDVTVTGDVKLWMTWELRLVDTKDAIVDLTCASFVGVSRVPAPADAPRRTVFAGVRDDDAIRTATSEEVVVAFDNAQYAAELDLDRVRAGAWL
jgi:eukaryotic-like serine/threonine-protein kinase